MNPKEVLIRAVNMEALVPVRFGINPFRKEDFDFVVAKQKYPSYLFIAIVKQENGIKVALGDARNHVEFKNAIRKDMGGLDYCELGQVTLKNGLLRRIILHHTDGSQIDDEKTNEKILSIINVFNRELLHPEGIKFTYNATAGDRWEYFPQSGEIKKYPLRDKPIPDH